jgi:glucans biosynthesis protein C
VAHSWTSRKQTSFANEWIKHIRNGQFLQENGPLWFCLALLIFSVAFAVFRRVYGSFPKLTNAEHTLDTGTLIRFALIMATITLAIRLARPPTVLNLPLRDFGQYVLLFGAGILLSRRDRSLTTLEVSSGFRWIVFALTVGFGAWLTIVVAGGALRGEGSALYGGWHWQRGVQHLGIIYLRGALLRPGSAI